MITSQTVLWMVISSITSAGIGAVVAYMFKRAISDRDEDLKKALLTREAEVTELKGRVGTLETKRVAGVEEAVKDGAEKRAVIYRRMDAIELNQARSAAEIEHLKQQVPMIREVSVQLSAAIASLEAVTEEVRKISAQQYEIAQRVAAAESGHKP